MGDEVAQPDRSGNGHHSLLAYCGVPKPGHHARSLVHAWQDSSLDRIITKLSSLMREGQGRELLQTIFPSCHPIGFYQRCSARYTNPSDYLAASTSLACSLISVPRRA